MVSRLEMGATALVLAACPGSQPVGPSPGTPVVRIMVTPGTATLLSGLPLSDSLGPRFWSVQLVATAVDANGYFRTGRSVTWASSDPAVATVSPPQLPTPLQVETVNAVGPGTATIAATSEGQTGTAVITVR